MLESAAAGRPVISVPLSLAKELDGGIITIPYDEEKFASEIQKLLEDREYWENWADMAAKAARERSWQMIVERLDNIYAKISQERSR